MEEHRMDINALYEKLQSDPNNGLTSEAASNLNALLGDNTLTGKKKTPWYVKLFLELVSPFALILWVGAILCFFVYALQPTNISNIYLAIVLVTIILVSGFAAFIQNYKSEAIMENFKNFIPSKAKVIRDGKVQTLLATKLVPGDIIQLKEGDRIPADIRVISCTEMRVDNSSLTGESEPLLRTTEFTADNPLETENLCFFGTLCRQGSCTGIILFIGDNTVIGQIAHLASSTGTGKTPLQLEMDRFVIIIACIAVGVGFVFFIIGFILGYTFITNLIFAIGLIIGNAPEGLLVFVTVLLTVCAQRMASKHVLAKNLQSVETLGATTCICSDKTGTLTQNRMTVENVWYDGKIYKALNKQKYADLPLEYNYNSVGFRALHDAAIISSDAIYDSGLPEAMQTKLEAILDKSVQKSEEEKLTKEWKEQLTKKFWIDKPTIGDASETALIKFFQPIEDILETRTRYPLLKVNGVDARVPFNSTNKFALSIVQYQKPGSEYCLLIKGAPERIWKFCSSIEIDGVEQPLNQHWKDVYDKANEDFGRSGQRVLGFGKLHLPIDQYPPGYHFNTYVAAQYPHYKEWTFPLSGITFVGLVSLIDPPRDSVPFSIIKCKTAGIKVIMVTGDQPVTAAAIAKKVNIIDEYAKTNLDIKEELGCTADEAIARAEAIVIHGDQITEATREDEELPDHLKGKKLEYWLSKKQIVFARTSPAQKLVIVNGCQKLNHIVGVTGDGVNDSPAIKKADIGIAMGITGSDVAKDAADLVLLTDDFSALVAGVEEGRKLYDNLKKCISYSMTTNIPEVVPFMLMVIFKFPLPVTAVFLLCLSIGTDMFPAISFAYEDAELDIMIKKPRDREEHLVTKKLLTYCYLQIGIFESFAAFLTYFVIMADFGFPLQMLFGLGLKEGYLPLNTDVYDPYSPTFGNSYIQGGCNPSSDQTTGPMSTNNWYYQLPDWIYLQNVTIDLRMVYVDCQVINGTNTGGVQSTVTWGTCSVPQISGYTGLPICFTIEALKYAQMGYFVSVVMCQWSNVTVNKTRRLSIYFHGLRNHYMIWGLVIETIFAFILGYIPLLNTVMGTRDVNFYHFGLPALPFSLFILFYDEFRKFFIARSWKGVKDGEMPGWWARNVAY